MDVGISAHRIYGMIIDFSSDTHNISYTYDKTCTHRILHGMNVNDSSQTYRTGYNMSLDDCTSTHSIQYRMTWDDSISTYRPSYNVSIDGQYLYKTVASVPVEGSSLCG